MQKSKIATYGLVSIILIFYIYSLINLVYQYNHEYLYIINPFFYIILALFIKLTFGKNYKNNKIKKEISNCLLIATLVYIISYLFSGMFLTFGKNPYATNLKGFLINIWIFGSILFLKEYIRYKLINNVYEKDKIKVALFIGIVFVIIDSEIIKNVINNISFGSWVKCFAVIIIPCIIRNILYSYIDLNAEYKHVLIYALMTQVFMWVCPILPNSPWIFNSIVESIIPLISLLYIIYINNKKNAFKFKETILDINPISYIPFIFIVIVIVLFSVGVFSIKPIAIATGSMEPQIMIGDVVFIKKCTSNDVIEGDIIQYQLDDYTVIHRVVKKEQIKGEFIFTTKGDNNKQVDALEVTESQLLGKVVFKIKYIGYPAIWLNLLHEQEQIEVETGDM